MSSSCTDTTTCACDPFDNCGCLNPSTFECTVYDGSVLPFLGINTGVNGDVVLSQIEDAITEAKVNKGKILIDENDVCPDFLFGKLEEGLNISFNITGTGCDRKLVINAVDGGTPIDVNVKATSTDTTSDYLNSKIDTGTYLNKDIINPGGDETIMIDLVPATLLSTDIGNQITLGTDGGLKTLYTAPDGSETKLLSGTGVILSGTGTTVDPYVLSTNPSIQIARPCFDNVWRALTLVSSGNGNVTYVSGIPQYRIRWDGSVEFRGSITYTVAFGTYQTSNREFTIPMGNMPTTCLTIPELAGTADLKSINYIDVPQASADQIVQQYGYIIRKSTQNILLEFQSSFTGATTKTIVVNFEGCVIHPLI